MDYKETAIKRLREYESRVVSIENLRQQLEALRTEQTAIRSASTDSEPVSGTLGSRREDAMIFNIMKQDALRTNLKIAQHEIAVTERGFASLPDDAKTVLDIFYIHHHPIKDVCEEMHIEKTTLYRKKDAALRAFTMACFGIVDL